jgi:mannan endo-1,4-beta-mannosidase
MNCILSRCFGRKLLITIALFMRLVCFDAYGQTPMPGIVYAKGTQLALDGYPFYFAGCNSYDLFTRSESEIDSRMSKMQSAGIKVVRTWGFSHESSHGFEPQKGKYSEKEFRVFDYIMKSASQHGIKITIVLENYWEAYGGIDSRLAWEGIRESNQNARSKFFTNAGCKQSYKNYIGHFVKRVNALTGIAYKDDPALFAWELMNEPRCMGAKEEKEGATLRNWIDEMAGFIKSLDPNHLVGAGIEGHEGKYRYGGNEGNPFVFTQESPYIDFCTGHPYPDESWADMSVDKAAQLVNAWIADAHEVVGKPFILEEYNVHNNKEDYWKAMLGAVEKLDAAGDMFWNYSDRRTSDFDIMAGDPVLGSVFGPHAEKMAAKNAIPFDAPGPFSQRYPANGAEAVALLPVFAWEASSYANRYRIVVSAHSDFSDSLVDRSGVDTPQFVSSVYLDPQTVYYWKVIATNPRGDTVAFNAGSSFTTRKQGR